MLCAVEFCVRTATGQSCYVRTMAVMRLNRTHEPSSPCPIGSARSAVHLLYICTLEVCPVEARS